MTNDGPEESEFKVGGRYKVQRTVPLFKTLDLVQQRGVLQPKEEVLLIAVEMRACKEVGLIVPSGDRLDEGLKPGWIVLQDPTSENASLVRRRLEGSWEMKARYSVKNPATVRQEPSLSSKEVGEVEPGQEVVVLELSMLEGTDECAARLRALVSCSETGVLGWISPETGEGDRLLDPVNLLGMEVVNLHRKSLAAGNSSPGRATLRGSVRASVRGAPLLPGAGEAVGGPRRSCIPGSTIPWEVGGKYRVLERLVVREKPELTSREVGKISPGALATITDIHNAECAYLGWCPCAFVTVDEGPEEGTRGWVRCAAKDGHDLMDTRDQLESEKILHTLRASQAPGGSLPPLQEHASREDEDNPDLAHRQLSWQNTSDSTSDNSGPSTTEETSSNAGRDGKEKASAKAEGLGGLGKLEDLDVTREDQPIGERSTLEGPEKSICNCNCGVGKSKQ